jgi:glucose-6-phosphate 1-dehydrogenase
MTTATELRSQLGTAADAPAPADELVVELDPATGVRLLLEAKRAPTAGPEQINLDTEGDSTRFTRQDSVEEAWRIMQPLLDAPPPPHPYAVGSWGPDAADHLVTGHGRWHEPWSPS